MQDTARILDNLLNDTNQNSWEQLETVIAKQCELLYISYTIYCFRYLHQLARILLAVLKSIPDY